jgi:hypothetical protein
MNKHFIRVSKTYTTKNKLQAFILEKMKEIDHTLCGSQGAASKLIKTAYDKACELYGGKASVPELRDFVSSHNTAVFYVPEVVYVEVYEVEKEFNVNKF